MPGTAPAHGHGAGVSSGGQWRWTWPRRLLPTAPSSGLETRHLAKLPSEGLNRAASACGSPTWGTWGPGAGEEAGASTDRPPPQAAPILPGFCSEPAWVPGAKTLVFLQTISSGHIPATKSNLCLKGRQDSLQLRVLGDSHPPPSAPEAPAIEARAQRRPGGRAVGCRGPTDAGTELRPEQRAAGPGRFTVLP